MQKNNGNPFHPLSPIFMNKKRNDNAKASGRNARNGYTEHRCVRQLKGKEEAALERGSEIAYGGQKVFGGGGERARYDTVRRRCAPVALVWYSARLRCAYAPKLRHCEGCSARGVCTCVRAPVR